MNHNIIWPFDQVILQDSARVSVPMITKIGRMVTYLKKAPNHRAIKHFDYVVLQGQATNETIISTLQECLWQPNLAEW